MKGKDCMKKKETDYPPIRASTERVNISNNNLLESKRKNIKNKDK